MLAILILSISFAILGSHATINEMVAAGQHTIPQNILPPSLNSFNTEIKGTQNNPINEMIASGQQTIPQNFMTPSLNSFNTEIKDTQNNPINEMVTAGQQTNPQNFMPPSMNSFNTEIKDTQNNLPSIQPQVAPHLQNGILNPDCPNTAILLNILNILTSSLHQDDKTVFDPEKFKYVLTVVKNFIDTTPMIPENLELYDKLKYLEAQVDNINGPIQKRSLAELSDKLRTKISLQYDLPVQRSQNCRDIFNNLLNFINTAYSQILKYCLVTEKCNAKNGMSVPSNYNGIYQLNPYAPIQRNSTDYNLRPVYENLPRESQTAGADFVNFFNNQQGKGVPDIMSNLKNYRPGGATYAPAKELENTNGIQNPLFYMNPQNNQLPSLYPPMNELNGKNPNLHPSNIYQPPNKNTVQTIVPGQNGLPGNTYANQQYVNFWKKLHQENNLGHTGSIYPAMKTPFQSITNGLYIPINSGTPNTNPNELLKTNPSVNKDPNSFIDILKQVPNPAQSLHNTNIKITHAEINKLPNVIDGTRLANNNNIQQYLKHLQNLQMQPSIPQNILSQTPMLPQQSMSSYITYGENQILNQYSANRPGVNNQSPYQNGLDFNQYSLGLSQISPFISAYNAKYINGQNMFTDNTKQRNNGGQLLDLNQLLGVANQGKLNSIPIKNGIVELTYMLKRPKPVYESQYYVKYRLPYQTFLYNLQNLMVKKPYLRTEPSNLYQELLVGSNVTDTPKDLEGLNYEDILKLTSTNGTLVTAKILDSNDTTVDKTLRLVQRLNSNLPVKTIIDFNRNATKNILLETQQSNVNGTKNSTSDNNNLLNSVYPTFFDLKRRLYPNNYPYTSIGKHSRPRLQYDPYSAYQTKPGLLNFGMPSLKYGSFLPNTNIVKYPILYAPYLTRNYYPQ